MKKIRFSRQGKRILAFALAFVMAFSTFSFASFESEATAPTPALEYEGREEGNQLIIEEGGFTSSFPYSQENVKKILDSKSREYDSICIQIPVTTAGVTPVISEDLWNAAVDRLDSSYQDRQVQYAFVGGRVNSWHTSWVFVKPQNAAGDVEPDAVITMGTDFTVEFPNTSFPSERTSVVIDVDEYANEYVSVASIFGTQQKNLEWVDGSGNATDTNARYTVGSWYDSNLGRDVYISHVGFGHINELNANTSYTLRERIYKGTVDTSHSNDRVITRLLINPIDAGKGNTAFTEQEILDILSYRAGEKFDEMWIQQPLTADTIYSSVVNAASALLTDISPYLTFAFADTNTGESIRWELERPYTMTNDQQVAYQIGYDSAAQECNLTIGSVSNLQADKIHFAAYMSNGNQYSQQMQAALGTDQIDVEAVGTSVYGWYGVDQWNTYLHLREITNLTAGTTYTLAKKKYMGRENVWPDGTTCFEINYNDLVRNGETFDEATLLNILNEKAKEGKVFNRVYIYAENGMTTIPASVWNAVKALVKTNLANGEWANFEYQIRDTNGIFQSWTFREMQTASAAQPLTVNTAWSSDGTGVQVTFPHTAYPAGNVQVDFHAASENGPAESLFVNALGTDGKVLEIADAGNNIIIDAYAEYDVRFDNNVNNYSLFIDGIGYLAGNQSYTVRQKLYHGEEGNDGREFYIYHWGFNGTGQTMNDTTISAILDQKISEGKKYERVMLYYPDGTARSVSETVWNKAVQLLFAKGQNPNSDRSSTLGIAYAANGSYDTKWWFGYPQATSGAVAADCTISFLPGTGMDVICSNTVFPAAWTNLELSTSSDNAVMASTFESVFGLSGCNLEVQKSDGSLMTDNKAEYSVYDWDNGQGKGYNIAVRNIQNFTAGETYRVVKSVYRGETDFNNGFDSLTISARQAGIGNAALTAQQILDILAYYPAGSFDQIVVVQPHGQVCPADKAVVDALVQLLDPNGPRIIQFVFEDYAINERVIWEYQGVSGASANTEFEWDFQINNGEVSVVLNEYSNITADNIMWSVQTTHSTPIGSMLLNLWGSSNRNLQVLNSSQKGEYRVWNTGLCLSVDGVQNLTAGTKYIIEAEKYKGNVGNEGDFTWLEILWRDVENQYGSFNDQALLDILSSYAAESFDRVIIDYPDLPAKEKVISQAVWNAARGLLKQRRGVENSLYFRFDSYETYGTYWFLYYPDVVSADVKLNTDVTIYGNMGGIGLTFENTNYPAQMAGISVTAFDDRKDYQMFADAFGAESQEMTLTENGVVIGVEGWNIVGVQSYDIQFSVPRGLKPNVEYRSVVKQEVQEPLGVEVAYDWNQKLSRVPDSNTTVSWNSVDANMAAFDANGMLTPAEEGRFEVWATYQSNGETVTDYWICYAEAVVTEIAFAKPVMDMECIPGEINSEWLKIMHYPANAYFDDSQLVWSYTTTDNISVELDHGNFSVKEGIGTVIVTAEVPGTNLKASCTIYVTEIESFPDELQEKLDKIVVVTNFAKTLGEIALPDPSCKWKEPKIALKDYAGAPQATFTILYTGSNGKTVEHDMTFPVLTITGLKLQTADGEQYYKAGGDPVAFTYQVLMNGGSWDDYKDHEQFAGVSFKATGMTKDADGNWIFENPTGTKAGKKTMKLELLYKGVKAVGAECAITLLKDETVGFREGLIELSKMPEFDAALGMWKYKVIFKDPALYSKFTVKSTDSSVVKPGKIVLPTTAEIADKQVSGTPIAVDIPFTEGKPGKVGIEVTLSNAVKSKETIYHEVKDRTPKVLETSFVINTLSQEGWTALTLQYADGYPGDASKAIEVDHPDFAFVSNPDMAGSARMEGYLKLLNPNLKAGTYTVNLLVPIVLSAGESHLTDELVQKIAVKVKVESKKPAFTVKQTKKVNLFYKQNWDGVSEIPAGAGVLTITPGNKWEEVEILNADANSGFSFVPQGDGTYAILADTSGVSLNPSVNVEFRIKNWQYDTETVWSQVVKISTEKKAPKIAMSQAADTLYRGFEISELSFFEKDTLNPLMLGNVWWVKSKTETVEILSEQTSGAVLDAPNGKYEAEVVPPGDKILFILEDGVGSGLTDTFKLRIQDVNWNGTVDVTYKITSIRNAPKLKLGNSKLTLNTNQEVWLNQRAYTTLGFEGYSEQDIPNLQVRFEGADAKSKAALNKQIVLWYDSDSNQIYARLNKASADVAGTYKYKVIVSTNQFEVSADFTVKAANTAVTKCLNVTQSGKLDVLRREECMAIVPKLSNLSGQVADAFVIGRDDMKFYANVEGDGIVQLFIDPIENMSTAVKYKIVLHLVVENPDGSRYSIVTPEQTIKVTQSKPKVTLTPVDGTTLYTQAGGSITANLTAGVGNSDLAASDVTFVQDYEGLELVFNEADQTICIKAEGMKGVKNFRKTLSLKLNVKFADQAVNVKDTQVVYKIKVQ